MLERGARDALAHLVLSWISAFGLKRKIGVYCSDVSGAFDKVKARRLVQKLNAKEVSGNVLRVMESWLQQREVFVIVGKKPGP